MSSDPWTIEGDSGSLHGRGPYGFAGKVRIPAGPTGAAVGDGWTWGVTSETASIFDGPQFLRLLERLAPTKSAIWLRAAFWPPMVIRDWRRTAKRHEAFLDLPMSIGNSLYLKRSMDQPDGLIQDALLKPHRAPSSRR